jgi:hypothetical protein
VCVGACSQASPYLLICCFAGVDALLAADGLGGVPGSFKLLLLLLPSSPMFLLLLLLPPPPSSIYAAAPPAAVALLMLVPLAAAALSTMAGMGEGISSSLRTCIQYAAIHLWLSMLKDLFAKPFPHSAHAPPQMLLFHDVCEPAVSAYLCPLHCGLW